MKTSERVRLVFRVAMDEVPFAGQTSMRARTELVVITTHGHLQPQSSQHFVVSLVGRNKISVLRGIDEEGRGVGGGVGSRNFHSLV
ncbi:hypothetical protein EVAR_44605_1 [Eumeta japonica]|uniref:Uncharacterized protein n=1 Tax=Eumeta variegata TaxID=151549 RepID=A0A4C1XAW3_EUMVA|nr:hypothetical protein EVAR_44605_1 [Eumeta japonica]